MTCRELVEFLMAYLDGELSTAERERFEEHLVECPACVDYLATYRETITFERESFPRAEAPLPEDVPEELVQAILAVRGRPEC